MSSQKTSAYPGVSEGGLRFAHRWGKSGEACFVCEKSLPKIGGALILLARADANSPDEELVVVCGECNRRYWIVT